MFSLKSVKLNHPVFPPFPPHPQSFLWSAPYCYPLLLKALRNDKIRQIKDIKNKYLNSKFDLHLHPDLSGKYSNDCVCEVGSIPCLNVSYHFQNSLFLFYLQMFTFKL